MKTIFVLTAAALAATGARAASQPEIEKCSREMGTLAVAEPQDHTLSSLSGYGLKSPTTMLRLMAQESGCFAVVERGVAMRNMQQERALAAGGQLQEGSNIGGGQMVGADFVMTPSVKFSGESGGVGAAVGGLLGKAGLGGLSGLAGGVKFKEAETTLLVADVRSGLQVASAEGKASKMDFALGGWGWGGLGWASGGGYSKTPEGKLIAASLLDNFNTIVQRIRDKPQLIRQTSASGQANAAQSLRATTPGQPAAAGQMAPVAAAPMAATGAQALPPGFFGAYVGQLTGGEQGNLSIIVGANGQVTGFGQTPSTGNFDISGSVTGNGMIVMTGKAKGRDAQTQFNGFINPGTGEIVGAWQAAGGGSGTFSGKRQ